MIHITIHSMPFIAAAILLLAVPSGYSAPISTIKNVPSSEQSPKFSNDPLLRTLKSALEGGDLAQFYEIVKDVMAPYDLDSASETLLEEKMDRQLLINWYAVIAPLFEVDADTSLHEACVMGRDIKIKERVMNNLHVISKVNLKNSSPSRKKEIARLCSIYAATVIRTLRHDYHADIKEENINIQKEREHIYKKAFDDKWSQFIKENEEYNKNWKRPVSDKEKAKSLEMEDKWRIFTKESREQSDKLRELANNLVTRESRNSFIRSFLQRREGALPSILLLNYPDKATEFFNYLKMAGYKEEEMMDLVDRTMGREQKTEFLYKSGVGRKFIKDKKKQNKIN